MFVDGSVSNTYLYGVSQTEDAVNAIAPRHTSLTQNLRRSHGWESMRVDGVLPDDLIGTLYRTGPGVYERFGRRVGHPFEADGVMSAVRFDGSGGAVAATAVVQARGYREEEARGHLIYSTGAHPFRRLWAQLRGRGKATGNTSMWSHDGVLYALMEGAGPVEIDPDSLSTIAESDLGGVIPRAFSAHPHRVASLRTSFNFGVRFGRTMLIDLFSLPDQGRPERLTTVEMPHNLLVHDFVVTEHHIVMLLCPATLRVLPAVLGIGGFDNWFSWQPELGSQVLVVPLARPGEVQRYRVDPFWFWHVGNAWDDDGRVVVDLCRYPTVDSLADIGDDSSDAEPPRLYRATIDPAAETCRWERRHERKFEFPHVHPAVEGTRHEMVYGICEWDVKGHRGICRVDADGALSEWVPGVLEQASEPVLVPRGAGEDDVWVLSLVHDDNTDRSYVAVLDGADLAGGPVARVWFDQPLPMTFHGTFVGSG